MTARARLVASGLVLGGLLALMGAATASAADDPEDFPLSAQVTASPTTPPRSPGPRSPSGADTPAAPDDGAEVVAPGDGPEVTPSPDMETIGGVLAVGGLRTAYVPSGNPLAGVVRVHVSVQNLSTVVIDPSVEFSLTTLFGMELGSSAERSLGRLAPGELRVVEVDLEHVGQWGVVVAQMTLTPPDEIDGVEVGPVARDRWLFAPPWFVVAFAGVAVVGTLAWRLLTRLPTPRPRAAIGAAS